jgi:hypothetical protein
MTRVLFLLKERLYSHAKTSYGLINSATHVAEYLENKGYCCKIVQVFDANFIDREVHNFRPDIVILEALWCPAAKLSELMELRRYKHITWIIRVHSDIGYLSAELQGMKLLNEYKKLNKGKRLVISMNSKKFVEALSQATGYDYTYLPNIITQREPEIDFLEERQHIDIGCFGAMRLLKNQCFQAICSILAAEQLGKRLFFHITPNLGVEKDAVLENLKELFSGSQHKLVIHDWLPNSEFQKLVRKTDIGMQLSFTESFNIVSADFINNGRLILVSDAISWLPNILRASTTDYDEVVRKIVYMYKHRNSEWLKDITRNSLRRYNDGAKLEWLRFLHNLHGHQYRDE